MPGDGGGRRDGIGGAARKVRGPVLKGITAFCYRNVDHKKFGFVNIKTVHKYLIGIYLNLFPIIVLEDEIISTIRK